MHSSFARRQSWPFIVQSAFAAAVVVFATAELGAQAPPLPAVASGPAGAPRATSGGGSGSFLPSLNSLFKATTSSTGSGTARARLRNTGKQNHGNLQDKLRMKGDLTLSGTSLRDALLTISDSWRINIVVGDEVEGSVNGSFRNAPLHEILHAILYANGFGYRSVGDSLSVTKLENLGDVNPLFASATIQLQAAKPDDVATGARHLISPQGKIEPLKSAKSILVTDLPERIVKVKEFARNLDLIAAQVLARSATEEAVHPRAGQFRLQFVKVAAVTEAIQSVLSKSGKATAIAKENRLVVVDLPRNLKSVETLVKQLDQPRPQVRITALIYDASLEDIERIGVNWNHALKDRINGMGEAQSEWNINSLLQAPAAAGDVSGVMTFMNLSRHFDITATIQLLNQSNNSRLLADPNVMVEDQESATIQIVTEIPFQQLTQTSAGGDIGTTSFREAGVTLNVSPHIANDATIKLTVTPTFSRLVGFTNSSNPQPIIDKREANTTVRVANRQTLIIGGLRQRTDINNYAGIPFLKDIKPLNIGKLFQSVDKTVRESELLVFLRPEIVTPMYTGRFREQRAAGDGWELLDRMPLYPRIAPPGGQPGCEGDQAPAYHEGTISEGYHYVVPGESSENEAPTISIPQESNVTRNNVTRNNVTRNNVTRNNVTRNGSHENTMRTTGSNNSQNNSLRHQASYRYENDGKKLVVTTRPVTQSKERRQPRVRTEPARTYRTRPRTRPASNSSNRSSSSSSSTTRRRGRSVSHAGHHSAHRKRSRKRPRTSQSSQSNWIGNLFK